MSRVNFTELTEKEYVALIDRAKKMHDKILERHPTLSKDSSWLVACCCSVAVECTRMDGENSQGYFLPKSRP